MNISEKLLAIQSELKAPKNQYNSFGKYKYRSAEDILEAVKPLTIKYKLTLKMSDELKMLGDHLFVEATARLVDCDSVETQIESSAQAVLDFNAKGMQHPQRTGAASSYAKKYALGNLFLLDDTKDSDATNTHNKMQKKSIDNNKPLLESNTNAYVKAIEFLKNGGEIDKIREKYRVSLALEKELLNQE